MNPTRVIGVKDAHAKSQHRRTPPESEWKRREGARGAGAAGTQEARGTRWNQVGFVSGRGRGSHAQEAAPRRPAEGRARPRQVPRQVLAVTLGVCGPRCGNFPHV